MSVARPRVVPRALRGLALASMLVLAACENPDPHLFPDPFDPGEGGGAISLALQVQPIFNAATASPATAGRAPEAQPLAGVRAGCYDPGGRGGRRARAGNCRRCIRIEPGASGRSSYLVRKITGQRGSSGNRMPAGGALSGRRRST